MLKIVTIAILSSLLLSTRATAQSDQAAAPADEPTAHDLTSISPTTTVTVQPDESATPMADPSTAAQFGSPSAVDSPGSPMPFSSSWPAIKPSAKRPSWIKKAPQSATKNPPAPPH